MAGIMNHHTITTTDENNNNSNIINNNNYTRNDGDKEKGKKSLEVPSNYKEYEATKCICYRPHKALECRQCHEYFYGRVSMQCIVHPTDIYLMDFRHCPYCMAPTMNINESLLSWEQIRCMEDTQLPIDSDEF